MLYGFTGSTVVSTAKAVKNRPSFWDKAFADVSFDSAHRPSPQAFTSYKGQTPTPSLSKLPVIPIAIGAVILIALFMK